MAAVPCRVVLLLVPLEASSLFEAVVAAHRSGDSPSSALMGIAAV